MQGTGVQPPEARGLVQTEMSSGNEICMNMLELFIVLEPYFISCGNFQTNGF